jgi:hypothetical protein
VRLPRWLGVDYWYVRGAKGALALLFAGQRAYAPVKAAVIAALKRGASGTVHGVRDVIFPALTERPYARVKDGTLALVERSQEKLIPKVREYQGDIAVGALVLAVSLTVFLIMRLL